MSQKNVELVKRVNAAYESGDLETVYGAYDPDIEWHGGDVVGFDDLERVYHGVDGIRRFFRTWFAAWETVSFEYHDVIDAGDEHVVVVLTQRMRGRASGIEIEWARYAQLWTVRDGKLSRMEFFRTREAALATAEARER